MNDFSSFPQASCSAEKDSRQLVVEMSSVVPHPPPQPPSSHTYCFQLQFWGPMVDCFLLQGTLEPKSSEILHELFAKHFAERSFLSSSP